MTVFLIGVYYAIYCKHTLYSLELYFVIDMEVELELLTNEKDEIQVMQKAMDLAKRAKELGFSIKEFELESEKKDEDEADD